MVWLLRGSYNKRICSRLSESYFTVTLARRATRNPNFLFYSFFLSFIMLDNFNDAQYKLRTYLIFNYDTTRRSSFCKSNVFFFLLEMLKPFHKKFLLIIVSLKNCIKKLLKKRKKNIDLSFLHVYVYISYMCISRIFLI